MGQKKNEWNFSEYDFLCFFDIYNHVDISQLKKKRGGGREKASGPNVENTETVSLAVFQIDTKPH